MKLIAVGMNHCTAPVEIRERFAIPAAKIPETLKKLGSDSPLLETVVISTCNRVEIYGLCTDEIEGIGQIFGFLQSLDPHHPIDHKFFYTHTAGRAVQHLFEVASGLNSMVLGETEVSGQVKDAYQAAARAGATGFALNKLFQKSFEVAKLVRTSSRIGEGSVSVGSVAADLAVQIFGDLDNRRVLLLGAGNMSATTAKALDARGCKSIIVSNRLHDRAVQLADELGGRAARFEDWPRHFLEADILISSTAAPHPIVSKEVLEELMEEREFRPAFLIDIAVPRDVERAAGELENVYLYDIDDLKVIADQNLALRQKELIHCKDRILAASEKFMEWYEGHLNRRTTGHNSAGRELRSPAP